MHLLLQLLKKKLQIKTNACKNLRERRKRRVEPGRFESSHTQFCGKKISVYNPDVNHSQMDCY